jgi:hypothetical protein
MPWSSRYACSSETCSLVISILLERRGDLGEAEDALLLSFSDERSELLDLGDRDLLRQQRI